MRKQTKLVAVLSAAALLAIGASMTSFAAPKGWTEEADGWVWLDSDGERVYNEWKKSGQNYFWLDENGVMATNRLIDDDEENIYYVDATGARVKDEWVSLENENDDVVNNGYSDSEVPEILWYYFGTNGKAYRCTDTAEDWVKKTVDYAGGSGTFFFNSEGQMGSGWIEHNNETYYCGDETQGYAHTWWQYLEPNDDMQGGDYDDQEWFYFGSKGGNGKMTKAKTGNTKTSYIDKRYYTFDDNGVLLTDWYGDKISTDPKADKATGANVWAYADENGALGTGWVYTSKYNDEDTEKWYYLVTINVDGVRRSVPFNSLVDYETGKVIAGQDDKGKDIEVGYRAKSIKGRTYLFDSEGVMVTGLVDLKYGTADYKEDADGKGNAGEVDTWNNVPTKVLANGTYFFKKGGYTSTAGQMQTGRVTYEDDGETYYYYFAKDGRAIKSAVKDGIVYGADGVRVQAEDGNTNEVKTGMTIQKFNKKGVLEDYIKNTDSFIVSSTGKLRTSGKVTIEGIKYTVENGVIKDWEVVD